MKDNKYNPTQRQHFFGWLIGHVRDTKGKLTFWPEAGTARTSADGKKTYQVQKDGSLQEVTHA
jgi:hypothetical protein